ncbi:MAG: hypothetical protein V2A53_02140 [bacterium]
MEKRTVIENVEIKIKRKGKKTCLLERDRDLKYFFIILSILNKIEGRIIPPLFLSLI